MKLLNFLFGKKKTNPVKQTEEEVITENNKKIENLTRLKNKLLNKQGKAYAIYVDGELDGVFPNINKLSNVYQLKPGTVYSAINKKGTYEKNNYKVVECLKY